jgi:hypothetical protein
MKTKTIKLEVRFSELSGKTLFVYCIYQTNRNCRAFCIPTRCTINGCIYMSPSEARSFEITKDLFLSKYNALVASK